MNEQKLIRTFDEFEYNVITEVVAPERFEEDEHGNAVKIPAVKKLTMKGIIQKADSLNQNGRIYPRHILDREVRNYQKFIQERRSLGECVPPGTEIYTKDGWKNIEDIAEDEVIATLDVEKNELQFNRINKKVDIPYVGKMYRFRNAKSYDMSLTPDHKVLAWDRNGKPFKVTAQELYEGYLSKNSSLSHSSVRKSCSNWHGEDPKVVFVGGKEIDSEIWAAFLGIYLAEGHASGIYKEENRKMSEVTITQYAGETADKIRLLMNQLPWSFRERVSGERIDFTIKDKQLHDELILLGGSRNKYVPLYEKSWSQRLLSILLEWMLLGDGRHRSDRNGDLIDEYCTTSKQLADDAFEIMLKIGSGATMHVIEPYNRNAPDYNETGRVILAENTAPMNIVYRSSARDVGLDFRFMTVEEFDYDGRVYCVNVKNNTWLMRQNGKTCWTGNCDHPDSSVINLKNASHLITEAYMDDKGVVYGTLEVLNTPSGQIIQSLVESKVKIGISSRGVGSTKKQGDYQVVQDDYMIICWDIVSEPSTSGAFMIPEGKTISSHELNMIFNKSDRIDRVLNDILSLRRNG